MNTRPFQHIDQEKIGECIGAGLQHIVYEYETEWVIKIPRLWMQLSSRYEDKEKELALMLSHFDDYIPDTFVYPYHNTYCYIQQRVDCSDLLSLDEIDTHKVILDDLIARNKELGRHLPVSVDFLSGHMIFAFLQHIFTGNPIESGNLVITNNAPRGFYLIDPDLLRTHPLPIHTPREILFSLLSFCMYVASKIILRRHGIR